MRRTTGIILNRLTVGFTFAFIYQFFVGIATSIFSLPLTGNVQDLISGLESADSELGLVFVAWWIISTVLITSIALVVVRYRRYLSPYKKEERIEMPVKITLFSAIIIGAIISFLFFLIDIIIGFFASTDSVTDIHTIYQSAMAGDLEPLGISILFSIVAGFVVVGVASKASKVREITKDIGIGDIGRLISKKSRERQDYG